MFARNKTATRTRMTSRFFRFLSKRGAKSSQQQQQQQQKQNTLSTITNESNSDENSSTKLNNNKIIKNNLNDSNESPREIIKSSKHTKLNDNCDIKESIEHYNQRCAAIKQLKEKENAKSQQTTSKAESASTNTNFLSFKSLNRLASKSKPAMSHKDSIECAVIFLDDTQENFFLPKKSLANKLYEQVYYHLDWDRLFRFAI